MIHMYDAPIHLPNRSLIPVVTFVYCEILAWDRLYITTFTQEMLPFAVNLHSDRPNN